MALRNSNSRNHRRSGAGAARQLGLLALAMTSVSCVPTASDAPLAVQAAPPAASARPQPVSTTIPLPTPAEPAESVFAFEGRTGLDRLRAHDCLAQAIYYEAGSESEDGQRAVAQVVLNRVRHPAWPDSICGVVYQGPMRPGGGCQFTFTCDGSLAVRPAGLAWARARALAAEALAGRVYEPIGLSTHYHTHAVSPAWAPALQRTLVIGAHRFYALPGQWGRADSFTDAYAGSEPLPRPAAFTPRRSALPADLAALLSAPRPAARATAPPPSDIPPDPRWDSNLPDSTVREAYRQSGQWRADAPAAITGR